jgi:hypothetical protein
MGLDIFVQDSTICKEIKNSAYGLGLWKLGQDMYSGLQKYHLQRNTEQFIWARVLEMGLDILVPDSGNKNVHMD